MSDARIIRHNGEPAISINGEIFPPMAMTTKIVKPDYIHQLGKSGMRIFFLMANTRWLRPGKVWTDENGITHSEPNGFEQFQNDAELLLAQVPDAYIIVRIGMHPPVEWMEKHPDDIVCYSDGKTIPAIIMSEVHSDHVPGQYSLCSQAWRQDGAVALQEFCDEVDTLPFADRVVGYFLAAGGTSEWYSVNNLTDLAANRYADTSVSFKREYSKILEKKYQTEEALREAWGKPDATFDNPYIPNNQERLYSYVDGKILEGIRLWEAEPRILGKELEINPHYESNDGVFLNANRFQFVADFYQAWHLGIANTIVHFAKVIKNRYQGKLVGAFYGSYGCTNYFDLGTATGTLHILNSGAVDFLAAPGVYNNREPGGYVAQREMQDSFRLRGQIFVSEEDSRTHREIDFYRDTMALYSIEDTYQTLKRDFARNLSEETFAWWFDQHDEGGRYEDKDIYRLFSRQQKVAQKAFAMNRVKNNEIALIYDHESVHYVSQGTNELMLDFYRTAELNRIGAPVDYYFHNDLERDDMPDYKMYVMINTFCLTEKEREVIRKKASKNHAMVVWLYAPGFINPDSRPRMDVRYITDMVGMQVERFSGTNSPRFWIDTEQEAVKHGNPDRRYGYIDRDIHSCIWPGSLLTAPFMNPGFYIQDSSAVVLGRYCLNNLPALAMKKQPGGWISVYCAPQILRADLLASLAAYAGCYLFAGSDDCLYANRNFVTIHAAFTGKHTLRFAQPCSPYEVYDQQFYGRDITELELEMRLGETKTFCVNGVC